MTGLGLALAWPGSAAGIASSAGLLEVLELKLEPARDSPCCSAQRTCGLGLSGSRRGLANYEIVSGLQVSAKHRCKCKIGHPKSHLNGLKALVRKQLPDNTGVSTLAVSAA